ncbi:hypothetical protein JYT50_00415 [bacterium AH-315-A23]|nr:hypothetical protein [bacterium AH-315-A23]PHS51359.1 MAG: hypothetical protein COB01_10650 [Lutibacter sp.]
MKKRIIKWSILLIVSSVVLIAGIMYYLLNQPHRNVQATAPDYQMDASALVNEYLSDVALANDKYLQIEGNSKIIAVTGSIIAIAEDLNQQKVVYLKGILGKAGVSCTFTAETNIQVENLKIGDKITIKGVIRSGAEYDKDLELYEDVILEKCVILHL